MFATTFPESVYCTRVRGLWLRCCRGCRACVLDAAFRVLRELGQVSPEERVVALERDDDAPERVVVA